MRRAILWVIGVVVAIVTAGLAGAAALKSSPELGLALVAWIGLSAAGLMGFAARSRPPGHRQPTGPDRGAAPTPQPGAGSSARGDTEPPRRITVPRPDPGPVLDLIARHQTSRDLTFRLRPETRLHCDRYLAGVRDAFDWNFATAQSYLNEVLPDPAHEPLAHLADNVELAARLLAIGCWSAGYEFQRRAPTQAALLFNQRGLALVALPRCERDYVEAAIGFAHWVLVSVLEGYYASPYGAAQRSERDGHFLDAHASFTRAALICFQTGLDPTAHSPT